MKNLQLGGIGDDRERSGRAHLDEELQKSKGEIKVVEDVIAVLTVRAEELEDKVVEGREILKVVLKQGQAFAISWSPTKPPPTSSAPTSDRLPDSELRNMPNGHPSPKLMPLSVGVLTSRLPVLDDPIHPSPPANFASFDPFPHTVSSRLRHCQQEVLAEARRTWVTMVVFEVDLRVHRDTPAPTLDLLRTRMESMFEGFRLCAGHWKADRIWTEDFSSWYTPPTPEAKPQNDGDEQSQDDGNVRPQPPLKKVGGFRLPHKKPLLFTRSSSVRPAEDTVSFSSWIMIC